jgi:hypothetical protein
MTANDLGKFHVKVNLQDQKSFKYKWGSPMSPSPVAIKTDFENTLGYLIDQEITVPIELTPIFFNFK